MQIVPVVDISHAKYYNFTAAKYIILRFRERLKICSSNRIVIKSIEMRDVQRIHRKKMDTRFYEHENINILFAVISFLRDVTARWKGIFQSIHVFFFFFFFHRYFSFFFSFEWKLDDYIQKRETHGKFSIHDNSVIEN